MSRANRATATLALIVAVGVGELALSVLLHQVVPPAPPPAVALAADEQALVDQLIAAASIRAGECEWYTYGRQVGYLATPHPLLGLFDQILAHPHAAAMLQVVVQSASPAARLYALTLLKDLRDEHLDYWLERLKDDLAPIRMNNGCTFQPPTTVAQLAPLIVNGKVTFRPPAR